MDSLTFLGTGGGRFVIMSQRRFSGGIWLDFGSKMVLDPGPGSLVRALQFKKKPSFLEAVIVSHMHLDHYNDAEVMIEAMTSGAKKKRGFLVCPENVLEYLSEYHKNATNVLTPKALEEFSVGDVKVEALPTKGHMDGLGFKFKTDDGVLTYSSDTDYSEEIAKQYAGSDILVLNVIFPAEERIGSHLNTDKAVEVVKTSQPKLCVITHFGMSMLNSNPEKQARLIQEETGIKTIAATDGQTITLNGGG